MTSAADSPFFTKALFYWPFTQVLNAALMSCARSCCRFWGRPILPRCPTD